MTDAELIVATVNADPVLSNLIGGRIYPLILPPTPTLPAVTYGLVSQPTEFTQDGAQYRWPRWRFRIWSLRYSDLTPIAQALAGIFGDTTPFASSWIEYPASQAEQHEIDTHRFSRAVDVIAYAVAGSAGQ